MVGTFEGSLLLVLSQTTSRIQYSILAGSHFLRDSSRVSHLRLRSQRFVLILGLVSRPQLERSNLDDVLSLASTASDSRSSRRTGHAQYMYSGPLLRNSPVLALRIPYKFSMNLLKELCRAHHVEGYSRKNPLAKELFLQALLWSCDPNCNACSNGAYASKPVDVLQTELNEEAQKNRENISATTSKQTMHRRPPLHPEPEQEEPGKARSRLFCCLVCSERVFGHNVRWVPEDDIKREESGIWKVVTNSTLRTDLRPPDLQFFSLTGRTHPSPTASSTERF
ncbi:BZ3500_MvSof-1268-A1-R1_Chr9g10745 [Microbotryum saponariae]|uniref:BZ3500_MvSof-1268-A1-R1_Chr9g10745 protein n=1 Tax=Microbotryum saponariae TaxID=289078 RepID=A0A2X0KBI7_9BASI|nr:BZ3501_MvSof-1269-A2-R1_Chr9g10493 [Microbotryum saponariae]SDA00618.1 BZ3500_MvSof-1268-A1-R1_Chr9g10745 [Microbotryum saponariae]